MEAGIPPDASAGVGIASRILEDSVQKQFFIILMLFLGLGIIFMRVLSSAHDKQDGYQSGCIDGECDGTKLVKELGIAESKKAARDELERNVGHCPCSSTNEVFINTGALSQVADSESGTADCWIFGRW